ncbi:MAG TPA: hypothetical protein VGZ73_30960 [Bryobacteraceae bacterium]|nr:hypothetical protein [Bryobacteraceae bacterium]
MKSILPYLFVHLVRMGGLGLLLLGLLDSSFLVMPLGNDLLVIVMTARHPQSMPYYAAMATVGSLLGCLLLNEVSRKGGEAVLEKYVSGRRLQYVQKKMAKGAGWALAVAALMPPPFPFTPFVMAAGALKYPRRALLTTLAAARLARFALEGLLAILFGRKIVRIVQTPAFEVVVFVLIAISILASMASVYSWVRKSKPIEAGPAMRP